MQTMSTHKVVTRFAPSPTGSLHVGNVRTALINWLFTRKLGGEFILRIDDTDLSRSKDEFTRGIMQDLSWLGLGWDRLEHQKNRLDRYEQVKQQLLGEGRLYPCFETEEELEIKRKILLSQGKPPVYDRASLNLASSQIASQDTPPHYRFKLDHKTIEWDDMVRGHMQLYASSISDPVVIRADGTWTYMLCSVVDDIDFKITHIIRGEDHISNTVSHIQMFEALGQELPQFAHLARITSAAEKISKRKGGFDIKTLRDEKGIEPMSINSLLALTGTSKNVTACNVLKELVASFDIKNFHKSPTNYNEEDIVRLNHKVLSNYEFSQVHEPLRTLGLNNATEDFWSVVRGNIDTLAQAKLWYEVCYGTIVPVIVKEDEEFIVKARGALPEGDRWNQDTWSTWITSLKPLTDRRGAELFMPLRRALTGVTFGPELKMLLPMIGPERAKKRLQGISA
jgi:glutamyl-tRNA synthetase